MGAGKSKEAASIGHSESVSSIVSQVQQTKYVMPIAPVKCNGAYGFIIPYKWSECRWFTLNADKKTGVFSSVTRKKSTNISLLADKCKMAVYNDILYVAKKGSLSTINESDLVILIRPASDCEPLGVYIYDECNYIFHYDNILFTPSNAFPIGNALCDVSKKYGNVVLYENKPKYQTTHNHTIFWYASVSDMVETFNVSTQRYWVGAPIIALKIHKNTIAYAYDYYHIHILNVANMTIEIIKLPVAFKSFIINDIDNDFNPFSEYGFKKIYFTKSLKLDCCIAVITNESLSLYMLNDNNIIVGQYVVNDEYDWIIDIEDGFVVKTNDCLRFYDLTKQCNGDGLYFDI
jgi:hypothetical protein